MFMTLFSLFCRRRATGKIEMREASRDTVPDKHQKQVKMAYNVTRYTARNGLRITALENPDGTVKLLRFGKHTWGQMSLGSYKSMEHLKSSWAPVEEKAQTTPRSTVLRYIDDQNERVTALVLPDGKVRILRYGAVTWRTARTTATYESVEELHKYVKPRQEAPTSNTYEPGTVIRGTSWVGRVTGLVLRNGMVRVLRQGSHTHRNGQITNHCKNVEDFLSQFSLESHHATFRG